MSTKINGNNEIFVTDPSFALFCKIKCFCIYRYSIKEYNSALQSTIVINFLIFNKIVIIHYSYPFKRHLSQWKIFINCVTIEYKNIRQSWTVIKGLIDIFKLSLNCFCWSYIFFVLLITKIKNINSSIISLCNFIYWKTIRSLM